MKAQVIILTLFLGLLSVNGFAKTIEPQESEQQKTVKAKYDFNLFLTIGTFFGLLICFDRPESHVCSI